MSSEMSPEQWVWGLALLLRAQDRGSDEAPLKHALCVANRPATVKARRDPKGTNHWTIGWELLKIMFIFSMENPLFGNLWGICVFSLGGPLTQIQVGPDQGLNNQDITNVRPNPHCRHGCGDTLLLGCGFWFVKNWGFPEMGVLPNHQF